MDKIDNEGLLDLFQGRLEDELLKLCTSLGVLDGGWLVTPDLEEKWREVAPEYMADAVKEVNSYPEVALAWAGYLGMGYAHLWDSNWRKHSRDGYSKMLGSRGFDDMDEHIVRDIIGFHLESREAKGIEDMMRRLGETALTLIRRERIEPQSPMAFHVYARVVKVMFRIGAAVELKRLGYKFEQVNIPNMPGGMATC